MTDPNQRCTCGFREFRERRDVSQATVQRWMFFDDFTGGGFGSTPFGTYFGAGIDGTWGEFEATLTSTTQVVECKNCARIRVNTVLGAFTPIASYVSGSYFYVVGADLLVPATCYEIRFDGPAGSGISLTVPLKRVVGALPSIAATAPPTTAEAPPSGAILADDRLRAKLPDIPQTATYLITLVDRCSDIETTLVARTFEAPPMVIDPSQADLSGYPRLLGIHQNLNFATQIGSGPINGIPFDYCEAVLEYDSRFGTLPSSQGWTHQAGGGIGVAGNYSLVEGGLLRAGTPGGANPSYWEDDASLAAAPTEVHSYASYLVEADTTTPADGEGLDFQALFAANAANYAGVRWTHRDADLYLTDLNTGGGAIWAGGNNTGPGWHETAGDADATANVVRHNGTRDTDYAFGTGTAAPADEIRARFGDVVGEGVTAYLKNFVVSSPGSFVRAWFRSVAPVTAPVLRLYFTADTTGGLDKTATFLIRYGLGTAGPYSMPTQTISQTVNFVDPNVMYEMAVNLTGMGANAPMWFTVERDWADSSDLIQSTVWMHQGTLRSS